MPVNDTIDLSAPVKNFHVTAGDDYQFGLEVKINGVVQNDAQLAQWQAFCQIRDTATWSTRGPLLEIGTGIDIAGDQFVFSVSGALHTSYLRTASSLSYDVELINPDGYSRTWLRGTITGLKDSTRIQ